MAFNFGSSSTAAPASGGFAFGSSAPAATPGFGSSTASAPAAGQASTGFSFGGTSNSAAPATGGFNFGNSSTTTTAPTTGSTGFGFGGNSSLSTTTPSTGFSFGGNTSTTAPSTTGFGFGSSTSAPAAPTSSGFGFGGANTSTTAPASSGFGFGSSNSTSMFGKPATTPSTFGFSGSTGQTSLFGAPATNMPGMGAPNAPAIALDMRFENLPADVQKQIKEFDRFLKEQSRVEASIKSVSAQPLTDLQENTKKLEQVALVMRNIQTRQTKDINSLKSAVKDLVSQAEAADQMHINMTSETGIQRRESMPSEYYWSLIRDFEERMVALKSQMTEVHMQLQQNKRNDNDGETYGKGHATPLLIQQILQSQNEAFMAIAANVANVHEQADELRDKYLAMLQRQQSKQRLDGAKVRNPFEAADRIQAEEERRVVDRIRLSAAQVVLPVTNNAIPQSNTTAPGTTNSFSFATPATSTAPGITTSSGFGGFGATTNPTTTSTFGTTPNTTSSFGAAPATSSFGAPAQPTLTKSVSFAGFGAAAPAAGETTNAFGMPAANTLNTKSVRRKSSSTKKR